MLAVSDFVLVHITEVNRTIGADLDVDRPKSFVSSSHWSLQIFGLIGRTIGGDFTFDHAALQRLDAKEVPSIFLGQRIRFVDNEVMRKPRHLGVFHRLEITKGIRIRKRAVLAETFLDTVAALGVMKAPRVSAVVSGIEPSFLIELDTKGIPATFGKDLIDFLFRMIAPDQLAKRLNGFTVFLAGLFHFAGDRTSL